MRYPIYFYVSQYHRETQPFAVPVHLVYDTPGHEWVSVRALAGRRAGEQFTIVRSELCRSPSGARLVSGGREAIAQYGWRKPQEEDAARRLRKRIGERELTERQLRNAFEEVMRLATSLRAKTQGDIAWRYFDRDLENWDDGRRRGPKLIQMIDMILGAATRYTSPPVDQRSAVYARAITLEDDANLLANAIGAPAREAPRRWLEVADALEVAEDAWREAGDEDRADNVRAKRQNILTTIKLAYGPRRQ